MGALTGLRVLDCGDFVAAPYAAKLLGQLGADVVKVEPPEGDASRRRGPFPPGREGPEMSGLHVFLNQAKRSAVLDLESADGRRALARLAASADALLASGSAADLERRGLTYEELATSNPALVVTTITPFGIESRRRVLPMRGLCDLAASGWLSISPGALAEPDLPPLKPFGQQAHFQAGLHAAVATLGALAERERSGLGQHVDVSVQAAIASQLESGLTHYTYTGRVASRLGTRIVGPWGILQLRDGLMFLICATEEEWSRLLDFLGKPAWAASPLFADALLRAENNDALLPLIEAELAGKSVAGTVGALQPRRIPCTALNTMPDLLASEHLRAREALIDVDHAIAGRLRLPGALWKLSATPWEPGRPAPLLGEHTDEVRSTSSRAPTSTPFSAGEGEKGDEGADYRIPESCELPLAGVRILEFAWVWAGPLCTQLLAHLGAEVIKIESSIRVDLVRRVPPFWEGEPGPNRSGYFNQYNQGKRSVVLDIRHPKGLELAHELARHADVVVDNFSAGVMERLGLGYETLRALKPDIVQISLSGHGQTGPMSPFVAYGPVKVPMIGLSSLTGYAGGEPREVGISYGDRTAGNSAALAVLAALRHRRRTGEGQYIDMSQWEAALPLVAEGLLTYELTGAQPPRMGNRDEFEAPQGVFRCRGDDAWLAISCWSGDEWQALAHAIARPDLADDPSLRAAAGRKAREAELEDAIAAWTATRGREDAAETLQAAGVPAFPVYTTADVAADAELAARGFWVELPHGELGAVRHAGIPWRFSRTPLRVRRAAPLLGEHTDEVLRELGLSDPEILALHAEGVLR